MSLTTEKSHWVFLLSSIDEPEERHIYDIAFGIFCLECSGIHPKRISIFIDGKDRKLISGIISNASTHKYKIGRSKDLFTYFEKKSANNLIMFVSGHGNIDGLPATPPIKPYSLLNFIKTIPNLKLGVLYLGQCYAGIFNYMSVGGKTCSETGNILEPPIVVVGATNLYSSISASTKEMFLTAEKTWVANLFLLYLFKWIKNPFDVDGDGKFSVMDSFKFAGSQSNDSNKKIKSANFQSPHFVLEQIRLIEERMKKHPTKDVSDPTYIPLLLDRQALEYEYKKILDIQFNHQEPWILNSIPAQIIEY